MIVIITMFTIIIKLICDSDRAKCHVCIDSIRINSGDWEWNAYINHRCITHAGTYNIIELTHFRDGQPCNVPYNNAALYDALMSGIEERYWPGNRPSLGVCFEQGLTFYTLTDNEIWDLWGSVMEDTFAERVAHLTEEELTSEFEHNLRKKISHDMCNGLLRRTLLSIISYVFDVLHFKLRFTISTLVWFICIMYCVWEWTVEEVLLVLDNFGTFTM